MTDTAHAQPLGLTPPPEAKAQPWRLLATLGGAGMVSGLLIVLVFGATLPTIEANKAVRLEAAIREVLRAPDRYVALYVVGGALTAEPPPGSESRRLERVFVGYRGDDPVGFAIMAGEPGFQDVIGLIFGYDPRTRQVLGMKVLETKETPGLGDKIEKDPFMSQFVGADTPLVGVKTKDPASKDRRQIQLVTGATISSRTVIRAINNALARVGPLLETYGADATTGGRGRVGQEPRARGREVRG
jgi:Na+-translocating ferredoxin:NAD+ oxidoreductase subunit G